MKRLLLLLTVCSFFSTLQAQETDTNSVDLNVEIDNDSIRVNPGDSTKTSSLDSKDATGGVSGVAVSPAHFHLAIEPGKSKTITVKVSNNTDQRNSFRMKLLDFEMNAFGKSQFVPPSDSVRNGLTKWINIAPTYVELAPKQKKKITLVVSIPDDEDGRKASWCVLLIEQETPKESLDPGGSGGQTIAFGIVPTFAFGVYIYQNPPGVKNDNVEIVNFRHDVKDTLNELYIEATNSGDGIAYCTSYIDLTDLNTGVQQRIPVKRFTILPGIKREFRFNIPKELPKGTYGAIGVIDYENAPEIQAAKLKFQIE